MQAVRVGRYSQHARGRLAAGQRQFPPRTIHGRIVAGPALLLISAPPGRCAVAGWSQRLSRAGLDGCRGLVSAGAGVLRYAISRAASRYATAPLEPGS